MNYKEKCSISGSIEKLRSKLGFMTYDIGERRTRNNDNIEPVVMLAITAFTSVKGSNHWHDAIACLVQELQLDRNDPRLHIEIDECQFPQMQILEAGHPAIGVWKSSLKPAILRILKESRMIWQTLQLVYFGSLEFDHREVTALIEVLDVDNARWKTTVAPKIREIIGESGCDITLAIWQLENPVF
ncbi:uncharacterized protein J3D65DRAFT_663776 [Phyllosticta citribraziliensis]|uniref:Uncharacterized protein n=1 Tax=Phyllosticta citribraziliensis TaxID=989973 RepID=A0ABR1MCJ2_9PEZI